MPLVASGATTPREVCGLGHGRHAYVTVPPGGVAAETAEARVAIGLHRCSAGGLCAAGLAVLPPLPPRADTPESDAVASSADSSMPPPARLGGHASEEPGREPWP